MCRMRRGAPVAAAARSSGTLLPLFAEPHMSFSCLPILKIFFPFCAAPCPQVFVSPCPCRAGYTPLHFGYLFSESRTAPGVSPRAAGPGPAGQRRRLLSLHGLRVQFLDFKPDVSDFPFVWSLSFLPEFLHPHFSQSGFAARPIASSFPSAFRFQGQYEAEGNALTKNAKDQPVEALRVSAQRDAAT